MSITTDIYDQHVYHKNLENRCLVCPSYVSKSQQRLNVINASKEELVEEVKKISSVFNPEVIVQDLILIGGLGKTMEDRRYIALAAELFIRMSEEYQNDFMFYLQEDHSHHSDLFKTALVANSRYHTLIELDKKGSSGLTKAELDLESAYAANIEKTADISKIRV